MNGSPRREDDLERLLTHLGKATADVGFEERISHGVHARLDARRTSRRRNWGWALAPAGALAMAAMGLAVWLHVRTPARSEGVVVALRRPTLPVPANPVAASPVNVAPGRPRPVRVAFRPRHATSTRPALEPGFPAPPAPLTAEERLLIQVAHRRDPQEIAMLDPHLREVAFAADRAEFDRFFKPPPPPAPSAGSGETPSTEKKLEPHLGETK